MIECTEKWKEEFEESELIQYLDKKYTWFRERLLYTDYTDEEIEFEDKFLLATETHGAEFEDASFIFSETRKEQIVDQWCRENGIEQVDDWKNSMWIPLIEQWCRDNGVPIVNNLNENHE